MNDEIKYLVKSEDLTVKIHKLPDKDYFSESEWVYLYWDTDGGMSRQLQITNATVLADSEYPSHSHRVPVENIANAYTCARYYSFTKDVAMKKLKEILDKFPIRYEMKIRSYHCEIDWNSVEVEVG